MPLPVAHGLVGASIIAVICPKHRGRHLLPLLIGFLLANSPDLDFILVWTLHSGAWHRAFTHSFSFALVVSLVLLMFLGRSRVREVFAYGLAFMSHGVLDYLTTKKGGGVELLWPASAERLKFGLWGLSEVPSRMAATEILLAILVEFTIFAPLLLVSLLLVRRHDSESFRLNP